MLCLSCCLWLFVFEKNVFQKKTTTSTFDRDVSLNLRERETHLIEIEMMMTARIQIIQKIIKFSKKKNNQQIENVAVALGSPSGTLGGPTEI